ncbi:MAG: AbrB/MazE/SpoVT family DNA-binding domain-containing protein [Actinomycetaceae bacterium]|nr:AbrB/MazE/SpoVT family DNA-binding domain-containing protein [Actinomycetaceae bacterium]
MVSATMTSKGQITVPKEVRKALNLEPGMVVDFKLLEDGTYLFAKPRRYFDHLFGAIPYDGPPISLEEMEEAIAAGACGE